MFEQSLNIASYEYHYEPNGCGLTLFTPSYRITNSYWISSVSSLFGYMIELELCICDEGYIPVEEEKGEGERGREGAVNAHVHVLVGRIKVHVHVHYDVNVLLFFKGS